MRIKMLNAMAALLLLVLLVLLGCSKRDAAILPPATAADLAAPVAIDAPPATSGVVVASAPSVPVAMPAMLAEENQEPVSVDKPGGKVSQRPDKK